MTRTILAVLFLSACTSTHGPALHQAAAPVYRPPPVTHTFPPAQSHVPAGAGASHGGLSAPTKPEVARSRNWRPGGNGPELMAPDDAPRASVNASGQMLFGEPIPMPDDIVDPLSHNLASFCIGTMMTASHDAERLRVLGYPADVRACLAARAFRHCIASIGLDAVTPSTASHRQGWRLPSPTPKMQKHANSLVEKWCAGVLVTREHAETLGDITEQWEWTRKSGD